MKECKPWSGDVLEEVSRPNSRKSVVFSEEKSVDRDLSAVEPRPLEDNQDDDSTESHPSIVEANDDWAHTGDESPLDDGHNDTPPSEGSPDT